MNTYVIGIDVGIRNLGLCALNLRTGRVYIIPRHPRKSALRCCSTNPSQALTAAPHR